MEYLDNLLSGLVLSGIISVLAYKRESLSESGVVGAMVIGTLIFGFGGWVWGLTLITFFVTSSTLSHYRERRLERSSIYVSDSQESLKAGLAEKFAKGHRRDLGQTLANGGIGALLAVAYAIWGEPALFFGFLGAMAAVNADTWATEIGVLNPSRPRLITTGQAVEVGASGGVSRLGTIASAGGAFVIGFTAVIFGLISRPFGDRNAPWHNKYEWAIPAALLAGLIGSLVDSLLGASVQVIFFCPSCEKETEKPLHGCGTPSHYQRGWHWLNNDVVNFLSSIVGALVAIGMFLMT